MSVLSNCGTSEYENTKIRSFERSSFAHNTFQLGFISNRSHKSIKWIEPIRYGVHSELAKKQKLFIVKIFIIKEIILFVLQNMMDLKDLVLHIKDSLISKFIKKDSILISDNVNLKYKMAWRSFYHLGPMVSPELFENSIVKIKK